MKPGNLKAKESLLLTVPNPSGHYDLEDRRRIGAYLPSSIKKRAF